LINFIYESVRHNLPVDCDAPELARQRRVEGVEKVILCYIDAIEMKF
jgi:hypothetical protein